MAQETVWELRPEEFSHQFAYFLRLTPGGTYLGGERARKFFLQSGLTYDILAAIWSLSDVDLDGQLSAAEFAVAMHLVHALITGTPLPTTLPQPLVDFIRVATRPQLVPPSDSHLQKCRSAFVSFQTNIGKGVLGAEAARYLLTKSSLPREKVVHIWTLADQDKDGYLTFLEFTVAMHLIYVAKLGHYLPLTVDANAIFPPSFYPFIGDIQRAADMLPVSHQPYVEPITPQGTPTSMDDKGFVSLQHFTMPPEAFRDREYADFVGNPFEHVLGGGDRELSDQDLSSMASTPSTGSREVVVVGEHTEPAIQVVRSVEILAPPEKAEVMVEEVGEEAMEVHEEEEKQDMEERYMKHREDERSNERERTQLAEEEMAEQREQGSEREDDDDDLEDISRASRKFLEESRDVFEEELHWVTPTVNAPFGMEQYRTASLKGLSETIEEIGVGGNNSEGKPGEESRVPVQPGDEDRVPVQLSVDHQPLRATSPQTGAARVISHMQQLEAQIMSALADTDSLLPEGLGPYDFRDTNALLQEMLNEKSDDDVTVPPEQSKPRKESLERGLEAVVELPNEPAPNRDAPSKRTSSPTIVPWERPPSEVVAQNHPPPPSKTKAGAVVITTAVPPPKQTKPSNVNAPSSSGRDKKPANKPPPMDDLDSILGDELASINDVFAEFEATDRKAKTPAFNVEQPKKPMAPVVIDVPSLDMIRRKKEEESKMIAQQWEEEAKRVEQEKMRELEMKEAFIHESDSTVQTLENEWKTLLQQEEQLVRDSQRGKEARLLREQEEQARLAKEREEAKAKAKNTPEEMPLEEWIEWVEKNRLKEMTPEQKVDYERKKKQRADAMREKEEQRKREEEEKLRRARQKMSDEQRMLSVRETDVKVSRIDTEELKRLQEQNAKKEAEEKLKREEKAKQWKERIKQTEIEELKPKAQSSLAARWEEKIKNRTASSKDYKSTVLGTEGMKASTTVATRKISTGN